MHLNNKETILVTGASGLIGSHLLQQLRHSDAVIIALCRNIPSMNDERFQWLSCDLLDVVSLNEAMAGVDKIYHCAGLVTFDKKRKTELFKTNIEGTANLINAALSHSVKKIVHLSSVAAIGEAHGNNTHIHEELPWQENKASDYAKSKHLAEMEIWRGICEGLPAVILNPSIVLGCADWDKGSTEIFKTIYNEFPWYTQGVHGFVDAQDVATLAIILMNSDIKAERFIANAANLSYKNLFTQIAQAFGKTPPHKKVTPLIASIVWRAKYLKGLLTGKPSILNKNTARSAMATVEYSNEKIRKALPHFSFTPLNITINRICKELKGRYDL